MSNPPAIAVIVSTYNQPDWLEKVLIGYDCQVFTDFEVVVADDGSDERTASLLRALDRQLSFRIRHVWHPDEGFRKTAILNLALQATAAPYLVFTDGDCIPRADFLSQHLSARAPGRFLSGGYFKLPREISARITGGDIRAGCCFDVRWLNRLGLPASFKTSKLRNRPGSSLGVAKLLNALTPTKASWNGMNSSGWREDILAVNGFDERMQYGGEDRELGERLTNYGVKGKQIRYSAICLHLWHERGYVRPEMLERNAAIRKETRAGRRVWTDHGIKRITGR